MFRCVLMNNHFDSLRFEDCYKSIKLRLRGLGGGMFSLIEKVFLVVIIFRRLLIFMKRMRPNHQYF